MQLALYVFWLIPVPVLIAIIAVMHRRKHHLHYSMFWAYACFQCLRLVVEFICKSISYKAYFYSYWSASIISATFTLLLLRAVFVHFLEKYPALDSVRRHGFEFAVSVLWFTALALNVGLMEDQSWAHRLTRAELIISFTEVGIFVFVLITTLILGIRWKSADCGIAAALGLLGATDLLVYTGLSWSADLLKSAVLGGWIETVAYDLAIAIFAFYFLRASVSEPTTANLRPELLHWTESMKGAMRK